MENEVKRFIRVLSTIDLAFLLIIIASFMGLISEYFTRYNKVLLVIFISASGIFILLSWVSTGLARVIRHGCTRGWVIYGLCLGTRLILSTAIFLAGIFGRDKGRLERTYVGINNIVAKHRLSQIPTDRMLILLPLCMQNKDCSQRVTENINNCRRCGCCKIGEVADLAALLNIRAVVAKGGTAARNSAKEFKPEFIFAVACERELVSGIADIGRIPAIGIINQRPNGYCTNTTVDIAELKSVLQEMTGYDKRRQGAEYEVQAKNPIA